jgi:hypothetical protein
MADFAETNNESMRQAGRIGPRLIAVALVVAALGLPVNHVFSYAPLLVATVLIFGGRLAVRRSAWFGAGIAALMAVVLPLILAPALIAEGDNMFLPGRPGNALERQLPADVYQFMQAEFDALYPPSVRCKAGAPGCWAGSSPDRAYAFSADGVFDKALYSRAVSGIEFSDPVSWRLGFINDLRYNWYTDAPDVHRMDRNRAFWMGFSRWKLTMPWFAMFQFPADEVGANLCWSGDVLWPSADGHYAPLHHASTACRQLAPEDAGRKIFAVAIRPDTLAVALRAPAMIEARQILCNLVRLLAVIVVLALLVSVRPRNLRRPFILFGLALAVIAIDDASFIGGWRPMDGGDDGLFYTGTGRAILQHLLDGNLAAALAGGEDVFYYGGPGLRYFRALEMIVFGDTNFGYLSIVLAMPLIVLALFKRFLADEIAWPLALVFTALPLGDIFGTSFFHYGKWAGRGFADPLAHILLIWGVLVIVGRRDGLSQKAAVAAGAALLFALAVFTKPIVAPMAGVMLGGAGLAALAQRQWPRFVGMCIGFLPVLAMPLHNWYFGHAFVLLSSNASVPSIYVMPPSAYGAALLELVRLEFSGEHLRAATTQICEWLSGPSGLRAFIPLHAAAVIIVGYVTFRGRAFDPWLRLIGAAVLCEYAVALVYAATPRYFFAMWLLTALIVAACLAPLASGLARRQKRPA